MATSGMRREFTEAIDHAFRCSKHGGSMCVMHCEDCNKIFCSDCFENEHEKHNCKTIDKAAKEEFDCVITRQTNLKALIGIRMNETERSKEEFIEGMEKTKCSIREKGEDLKKQIDDAVERLLQKVDAAKLKTERNFTDQEAVFDGHLKKLEKLANSSQAACDAGNSYAFIQAAKELDTAVEQLKIDEENIKPVHAPVVCFIPAVTVDEAAKIDDTVGRLKKQISPMTKMEASKRQENESKDREKENETLKKDVAELSKLFKEKGLAGYIKGVDEKIERWRQLLVNIAIIGNSGVGKSSFINAIRRMTADDGGAAEVAVNERTRTINYYSHPDFPQIRFCDLPGVGTPGFPKDTYLNNVSFDSYDFFLLVSDDRFKENDFWLAQEITKADKKFYFVRTKVGIDVSNGKDAKTEKQVLDEIRSKIKDGLRRNKVDDNGLFLIDNYQQQKFEFDKLERHLMVDVQQLKPLALTMSIAANEPQTSSCVIF